MRMSGNRRQWNKLKTKTAELITGQKTQINSKQKTQLTGCISIFGLQGIHFILSCKSTFKFFYCQHSLSLFWLHPWSFISILDRNGNAPAWVCVAVSHLHSCASSSVGFVPGVLAWQHVDTVTLALTCPRVFPGGCSLAVNRHVTPWQGCVFKNDYRYYL